LITPGLFDLQMNGFRAVDVATATAEELLMLDSELAEFGVTSWLASFITRDLSEMT
jgi:N-acetylglucosamine-6-phosphate deacetylase